MVSTSIPHKRKGAASPGRPITTYGAFALSVVHKELRTKSGGIQGFWKAASPNKKVAAFARFTRSGEHGSESRAGNF
jgi:hypothetical protein